MTRRAIRLPSLCSMLVGLLCCTTTGAAAADTLNLDRVFGEVKGWKIGFSEALGGCAAAATFQDETTVWVGFGGHEGSAYVAFSNPGWKSIQPNGKYELDIRTGRASWRGMFSGFERENEKGIFASDLKSAFVEELVSSLGLRVYLNRTLLLEPSLHGSRDALTAVSDCQRRFIEASIGINPAERVKKNHNVKSSGTGFFASSDGHIITNHHVIDRCSKVTVVGHDRTTASDASVVAKDNANDLALLRTANLPTAVPALRFQPKLGENVSVFGYPLSGLLSSSGNFTPGAITATAGLRDDSRMLQTSAPVQPGNSGGPLIDKYGNVVGVIVAKLDAINIASSAIRDIPQNVNFAIKANIVANFMTSNGVWPNDRAKSRELPPETVAEFAGTFTVQVFCH